MYATLTFGVLYRVVSYIEFDGYSSSSSSVTEYCCTSYMYVICMYEDDTAVPVVFEGPISGTFLHRQVYI